MHKNRLEAAGVKDIRVKIFNINEKLTELNQGILNNFESWSKRKRRDNPSFLILN